MKRLILTALAVSTATAAFAQGTVAFNNRVVGTINNRVYIYTNGPAGANSYQAGNGTADTPTGGTTSWVGYTGLTGSGWMAAIMAGVGGGLSESALSFGTTPTTTTFRGGINAGGFVATTATLNNVPIDTAMATLDVFVWNSAAAGITDPAAAYAAWKSGSVLWAGGTSGAFNVANIGGVVNGPPNITGMPSFSVYIVPEPATMALAGLGAAAMLIFRRRK
jgi:hypothetical protein